MIFAGGETDVDKAIIGITGGRYSHVGGYLFDSVYESTGIKEESDPYPGVWLHNPHKYDSSDIVEFIEIGVPDLLALKQKARELLGTVYGYSDCIKTGIAEIFHVGIPDNEFSMHCSETWTRLLRAGGLDILPDAKADSISPNKLYEAIKSLQ